LTRTSLHACEPIHTISPAIDILPELLSFFFDAPAQADAINEKTV
jgi:hypothetical protein